MEQQFREAWDAYLLLSVQRPRLHHAGTVFGPALLGRSGRFPPTLPACFAAPPLVPVCRCRCSAAIQIFIDSEPEQTSKHSARARTLHDRVFSALFAVVDVTLVPYYGPFGSALLESAGTSTKPMTRFPPTVRFRLVTGYCLGCVWEIPLYNHEGFHLKRHRALLI